jgi:serine/threonine protein phosphatase 1
MGRLIAIGDLHGCLKTFLRLIGDELNVTKEDEIILLGDLIDRGPYIRELVDEIIGMQNSGYKISSLMGNHEWLLLKSLDSEKYFDIWIGNKARTTLQSFHVNDAAHLQTKYIEFFKNLAYFRLTDDFVLVHGGMNFAIENPFNDTDAMVWTRNDSIDRKKIGNRRLIVGHTPSPINLVLATQNMDRVLMDGGCVYKDIHPGLGYLCAMNITDNKIHYIRNIDF